MNSTANKKNEIIYETSKDENKRKKEDTSNDQKFEQKLNRRETLSKSKTNGKLILTKFVHNQKDYFFINFL